LKKLEEEKAAPKSAPSRGRQLGGVGQRAQTATAEIVHVKVDEDDEATEVTAATTTSGSGKGGKKNKKKKNKQAGVSEASVV